MDCQCRITNTGTEIMKLTMENEQYQILQDAARVYWYMLNYQIRQMMQYYTEKKLVLDLAEIVEKLYDIEAPEDDPSSMERLEQIQTFVGRIAGEDVVEDSCYPECVELADGSLISCGASFVQPLHA